MKKKILLILSLVFVFFAASCKDNGNTNPGNPCPPTEPPTSNDVVEDVVSYTGFYEDGLKCGYTYKDEYFLNSGVENNTELAKLSLCSALAGTNAGDENQYSSSSSYISDFYSKCKFKGGFVSPYYRVKPNKEHCGFYTATKEYYIRGTLYTLIGVTIRGFKYEAEWASNFNIGEAGNHAGFDQASDEVIERLRYLINNEYIDTKVKVWITGYSRGGAIAGLTAAKLIDQKLVTEDNLYAYIFEAPASMKQNEKEYNSIHNYINPNDVVTKMVSSKIKLVRPGSDIDYVTNKDYEKVEARLAEISSRVVLAKLNNIDSLSSFLDDKITKIYDAVGDFRATYYAKYQEPMMYILDFVFSLTSNQRSELLGYFKALGTTQIMSLVVSKDAGIKICKNAFEACNINYNETEFSNAYTTLYDFIAKYVVQNLGLVDLMLIMNNVSAIAQNHFAEVTLAYMIV